MSTTSGKGGEDVEEIKLNEGEQKLRENLKKTRLAKEDLINHYFSIPHTWWYGEKPHMFDACTSDIGSCSAIVEDEKKKKKDEWDKFQKHLESFNIDQLQKIKRELDEYSTEEELRGKILSHFMTANDMFEEHQSNDAFVNEPPEGEQKPRATCLSRCGRCSETDDGDLYLKNVPANHRLLAGATREHKLRALLKTMTLPDLRRLRDQFHEEDETAEIIDQVCNSWKMEVFRRQEEFNNKKASNILCCGNPAESARNKNEFYWGGCIKMDISEEYSFVPGDRTNTLPHFLYSRWKHSNLRKYLGGFSASLELTPEETDQTVNALILLEALILTIPFGLIPNLGIEFWDNLQEKYQACSDYPENWTANRWFKGWHSKTTIWIQVVIYVVTAAISLACFYCKSRTSPCLHH